ncbi:hypothetical protein [Natrinema halophilum]|uniref:Uncharacterized protein n=1 Tax=Natrinema halophilum TaxID=1699371 RepID=A0A7D5GPE7_9EURY|nr:hypothetical protein [Natrinema halophilum]QLG50353.1 hypothetical protein HYG82_16630 [Natrinema halophilum]
MRVKAAAKAKAEEAWSEFLLRCAEAEPVDQELTEEDVYAIVESEIQDRVVDSALR